MPPAAATAPNLERQTRERLECGTVLQFFAQKCQTDEGRQRLLALAPLQAEQIAAHYNELEDWAALLERRGPLRMPPIPAPELFERNPHLKPFDAGELRELGRLVAFWIQLCADAELAFTTGGAGISPELNALSRRLSSLFDPDGDWNEHISPRYSKLIHQWVDQDRQLTAALQVLMRRLGAFLNEEIVFERNHRRVLAVKADFRGRVKGILHDYSSSGSTTYIEPEETVAGQNQLTELESEIREELWRIRVEISSQILAFPEIAARACPLLARADMMQALAQVAKETGCTLVRPNHARRLALVQARHPFLCERFAAYRQRHQGLAEPDGNRMVAFDLELEEPTRGLVISGANTGGKTVTLKTTGLLAWLANSGLPVSAAEGSAIPHYRHLFADIGDNQSLSHNLSTFASHLANIVQILRAQAGSALVLLDELGSGTDPAEGNALAQAIIEEICRRDFHLLVTTHQQILCTMALTHPQLDNGSMVFDMNRHLPTYKFTQGVPGRSHALDIARAAGLPPAILEEATRLIDADLVDIQAAIRILQQQNKELDKQRGKLRKDELRLHRRIVETRQEKQALERLQDELREKAKQRLQKEVEKAEHKLRQTLAELSGGSARSAVTKFARARAEVLESLGPPEKLPEEQVTGTNLEPSRWQPGDTVYLKTWRREGKLVAVDRKKARVDVGGMKLEVMCEDLIHQGSRAEKPGRVTDFVESGSDIALSMELRLLGYRVEDALLELDTTIDRALRKGIPFIRIIHGHGHGALKQAVREFLGKHPSKSMFEVVLDQENDGVTELKF